MIIFFIIIIKKRFYLINIEPGFLAGSNAYHLRVYVYQARNLTALDQDSFSGVLAVFLSLDLNKSDKAFIISEIVLV